MRARYFGTRHAHGYSRGSDPFSQSRTAQEAEQGDAARPGNNVGIEQPWTTAIILPTSRSVSAGVRWRNSNQRPLLPCRTQTRFWQPLASFCDKCPKETVTRRFRWRRIRSLSIKPINMAFTNMLSAAPSALSTLVSAMPAARRNRG